MPYLDLLFLFEQYCDLSRSVSGGDDIPGGVVGSHLCK